MLTPRQRMILNAIVENYVGSAEPVGSRILAKNRDIQLSPATIRNEMADLEELGYLAQPHTSAGRIPSQKGYRFYVDNLMDKVDIDGEALDLLRDVFRQKIVEVEKVVQQTSVVLSQLTQYTAIVLGPRMYREKIKQIQLVPLSNKSAVAILITDTGHVENRQVRLSEDISADEVVRMVNLLNARLIGTPLYRMRSFMHREIAAEMAQTVENYEDAIAVLDDLFSVGEVEDGKVYVGGSTNMLVQPEFRDVTKVRPLLEMFEQMDVVQQVVPVTGAGLQIRIGQENMVPTLKDCSVISVTYSIANVPVGSIGVIGPTRMNYSKVIRILEYVSGAMSQLMTERLEGH